MIGYLISCFVFLFYGNWYIVYIFIEYEYMDNFIIVLLLNLDKLF